MENLMFPMSSLRVSFGENKGNHRGTFAMDFAGRDGGKDPIYAPCSGVVKRIRDNANGELYLWSDGEVRCPGGFVGPVTITLLHDTLFNVVEGQHVRQGDYIYDEGGMGHGNPNAFGNHLHLEICKEHVPPRQTQNRFGQWHTVGIMLHLYHALYLSERTQILNSGGYPWVHLTPTKSYTVRPGDSWWSIAAQQLGAGNKCVALAAANGKTLRSTLHPGDELILPPS